MGVIIASVNKVILLGNLGGDPEVRYSPSGDAVANFSLATTEKWKDGSGEPQERTDWHRVTLWRRLAEIAGEYLKKGSPVYIEGRINYREYTDKEGVKKWSTDIVADRLQLIGARRDGGGERSEPRNQSARQPAAGKQRDDFDDTDIPF